MKVIHISVLYPTENTSTPRHQKVPFLLGYFSAQSAVLPPEALGFAPRWESSVSGLATFTRFHHVVSRHQAAAR